MGIVDISKKIDSYKKEASKDVIDLSNKILTFQKESVEKLKEYL